MSCPSWRANYSSTPKTRDVTEYTITNCQMSLAGDIHCSLASSARTQLVIMELTREDILVHRRRAIVQRVRQADTRTDLGALPRNDHQRLRRLLVAENRDAGHLLRVRRLL